MTEGVLIFAHNSREVDYALMSLVSGGLAKKNLGRPVTLITDKHTLAWMSESGIEEKAKAVFENIIEIEKPSDNNTRKLADGSETKVVPFVNSNRCDAFNLSPYDRTLLIDGDFLIFSDRLNAYWDVDTSVMISPCMVDIRGDRVGVLDRWIADTGIPMYWATTVMFTKNKESEIFFNLVDFIKKNYDLYSSIYRFNPGMYRNDISFSVAKHILDGFETPAENNLPGVLTSQDKDLIYDVTETGIKLLMADPLSPDKVTIGNFLSSDLHIMNKQAIVRFADKFLEMI
jgi:hypothetical protein